MAGLQLAVASTGTLGKLNHASGNAYKTAMEITNGSTSPIRVRYTISFFGTSATDAKACVQLARTATASTGTAAGTSPTVVKVRPNDSGTVSVTAREGFTAEPTTTNQKILQQVGVHLQNGWTFDTTEVEPGDNLSIKILHTTVSPDYTISARVEQ